MPHYKVRPGQVIGKNDGEKIYERHEGEIIEMTRDQAIALGMARVDPVDPDGNPLPAPPDEIGIEPLLEGSMKHERRGILQEERDRTAARLEDLDRRLAEDEAWRARVEAGTEKPEVDEPEAVPGHEPAVTPDPGSTALETPPETTESAAAARPAKRSR